MKKTFLLLVTFLGLMVSSCTTEEITNNYQNEEPFTFNSITWAGFNHFPSPSFQSIYGQGIIKLGIFSEQQNHTWNIEDWRVTYFEVVYEKNLQINNRIPFNIENNKFQFNRIDSGYDTVDGFYKVLTLKTDIEGFGFPNNFQDHSYLFTNYKISFKIKGKWYSTLMINSFNNNNHRVFFSV